jgi:hypothetical protein
MGKMCIVCQTSVEGTKASPVKEDRIIKIIRAIKKQFGLAQMNELYVCVKDLPKQAERRKSFEKSMMIGTVLAGLIGVVLLFSILSSGKIDIWPIVSAVVLAGAVMALPVLRYAPAVSEPLQVDVKKTTKKR